MPYPTAGVGGSITVGSTVAANLDVWAVTQKAMVKDTTSFGASGSWQTNTSTIRDWSAKMNGRADPSDTNGQLVLINGLGSTVTLKFNVDGTHYWSGSAIVVGVNPKADANDVVTVQYDVTGTGALSFT
jgi:predicted secreted protein